MIALRKSVLPTNFLMIKLIEFEHSSVLPTNLLIIKLIELEHLSGGTATLNMLGTVL